MTSPHACGSPWRGAWSWRTAAGTGGRRPRPARWCEPWRPPGNRAPTQSEIAACQPFLERQIELLRPRLIVFVGGIAARALDGVAPDKVVVLFPDPAFGCDIGRPEQGEKGIAGAIGRGDLGRRQNRAFRRFRPGPVIDRRFVGKRLDREVCLDLAVLPDDQAARVGDPSDHREIEPPFAEDRLGFLFLLRLEDHERVGAVRADPVPRGALRRVRRERVDEQYPEAERIRVVLDNLSAHSAAALYQAFPPAEARRILSRLELHFTPKHASWLNMVEIEIVGNALCLDLANTVSARPVSSSAAWRSAIR